MDRKCILFACVVYTVLVVTCAELDKKTVQRTQQRGKYNIYKDFAGESTKLVTDNEKYTEGKSVDYSSTSDDKQYDTDNSKGALGGSDYGGSYKGEYDDGKDADEGKKEYKDYGDSSSDVGKWKDTSSDSSYNSVANKNADVTCSYGVKFIAHPYECTKFYQCAHSKPFLFTCPSGLYFNSDLDVCDWPSNVDCSNDYSNEPADKTSYESNHKINYEQSHKSNYEPSHKTNYEPSDKSSYESSDKSNDASDYQHSNQYKSKPTSNHNSRISKPTPEDPPTVYEDTDSYEEPTYKQHKYYSEPKIVKDSSKHYNKHQSMSSKKPVSFQYPMASSYQPMMSPQFIPVPMFPMYHPFIPLHSDHNNAPIYKYKLPKFKVNKQSEQPDYKDYSDDKESKKKEESTDKAKKIISEPQTSHSSGSTVDNGKSSVQTVKKVIIKKSQPEQKLDVPTQSKTDTSKRIYYYYYDDDVKDNGNKNQQQIFVKDIKKKPFNYYYVDTSSSNSYKDSSSNGNKDSSSNGYKDSSSNGYKDNKKSDVYDYDKKYYYDYGNDYDYGYDYNNGQKHAQDLVSVDKHYNRNKKFFKSNERYQKDDKVTDEDLGFIHFDHMGRGSKGKAKGQDHGDLGSLLPLLLLGGANGGQQLLITSLLLSKFKSGGGGDLTGGKSGSGGEKDDLIKKLVLLSLLTGNRNVNAPAPVNVPNVQIVNGQFVNAATGQPAVLIDPVTGQQVTPAQTSINPATGQLVVTATGNPVFLQDPATGNLQVAIVGNALPLQGNPILPPVARRRLGGRRINLATNNNNNRFIPLAPPMNTQTTAPANGRDAVNLIFLSPLTPSSLPPAIINNDGSATLIRGSLRDILGPNLANFISNVPLVPGQGPPNSVAGNKQSCNVVRSGETVPFRISPRGGRLLPSECEAIGKLLDKFVPTFLQNFVPSDAAFAGFGSNGSNRNLNNNLQPSLDTSNRNGLAAGSSSILNSGSSSNNNLLGNGSINDFINVRNDQNGCTIAVPNIVPQC